MPPSEHRLPSTVHRQLVAYFRSGWAFLIPYLAAYLLYAWLKWPVNPVAAGSSTVGGGQLAVSAIGALPSTGTPSTAHSLLSTGVPCLLHVYWFLHALHLVLGALALRAWWKGSGATVAGATDDSESVSDRTASSQPSTVHRAAQPLLSTVPQSGHRLPSTVYRLLPWLLLALLFYIPGVYLEWPSDPWEHLRRINEWRVLDTVTAHSTWMKSSYFIPYSLLSWCVGLRQIFWLDFYYTGICLLLCWQYYRLARACDLGKRASMVFVLLQALLFGNNIFSFYRYYGISSSIYAQLGAVALTRIVLEAAKHPQLSLRSFFSVPSIVHRLRSSALRQPPALRSSAPSEVGSAPPLTVYCPPSADSAPTVYRLLLSVLCLLPLIRYNHPQGLGIAGLGVGAVIIWRLIEWRRSALWWLIVTTLVTNVLFLWLYPRPVIIEAYRTQGWLNAWYGFNILDFSSPVSERALQIVGAFGLINLAAVLLLLRRNHVIGWLTVLPILGILLPCISIPLSNALAKHGGPDSIITVTRILFAIPPSMALVCLSMHPMHKLTRRYLIESRLFHGSLYIAITCLILVSLTFAYPTALYYNRIWQVLSRVPEDLSLKTVLNSLVLAPNAPANAIATASAAINILQLTQNNNTSVVGYGRARVVPSDNLTVVLNNVISKHPIQLAVPSAIDLFTPYSIAAVCSNHWLPQEAAFAYSGAVELNTWAEMHNLSAIATSNDVKIIFYIRR